MRVGIIGFGNIGRQLRELLLRIGWEVSSIISSRYVFDEKAEPRDKSGDWSKYCQNVDVVFLAIPTSDDGKIAFEYITRLVKNQIPVVTCEKGALSNYYEQLKSLLPKIGYSATVGAGSGIGMIRLLQQEFLLHISYPQEIHAVLNSTLNYIWCYLKSDNSLSRAVEAAKRLGYVEPGDGDPFEVIFREACLDIPMKAVILFNSSFRSGLILRPTDIKSQLTRAMIEKAISEANERRFVVSFVNSKNKPEANEDILAFSLSVGEWSITGGFKKIEQNPLILWACNATRGRNNFILVDHGENKGGYFTCCIGPGAGALSVATAMIRDAVELLRARI